ncbi:hypothetical protein DFH29DRAFT_878238 [Suillus ampliporus]|nr:hypothetical protein DFH29DRAFT_878238 [Suillus ampliporus]
MDVLCVSTASVHTGSVDQSLWTHTVPTGSHCAMSTKWTFCTMACPLAEFELHSQLHLSSLLILLSTCLQWAHTRQARLTAAGQAERLVRESSPAAQPRRSRPRRQTPVLGMWLHATAPVPLYNVEVFPSPSTSPSPPLPPPVVSPPPVALPSPSPPPDLYSPMPTFIRGEASDTFSVLPKLEDCLTIKQKPLVFKLEDVALKLENIKKEEDLKEDVIEDKPVTQDEQANEEQNNGVGIPLSCHVHHQTIGHQIGTFRGDLHYFEVDPLSLGSKTDALSPKFLKNEMKDLFMLYLITYHLSDDFGNTNHICQVPPTISEAQWCFRAMAGAEIYMKIEQFNNNSFETYQALIHPYLINSNQMLFTCLCQKMAFLSTLSYTEPGLPRFGWNPEMTVLSINGFALPLNKFKASVESSLLDMMDSLFHSCPWQDILDYIDHHTDPTDSDKWFLDRP